MSSSSSKPMTWRTPVTACPRLRPCSHRTTTRMIVMVPMVVALCRRARPNLHPPPKMTTTTMMIPKIPNPSINGNEVAQDCPTSPRESLAPACVTRAASSSRSPS
uniref:(northern house mosquito) hypothetical protein n=1 Tax=Culex pipiens TaxID=7175 RepID=A0A8D8A7W0_CULPI